MSGHLLLHRETPGFGSLFLFAFALDPRFVVDKYRLREDYVRAHDQVGRWSSPVGHAAILLVALRGPRLVAVKQGVR